MINEENIVSSIHGAWKTEKTTCIKNEVGPLSYTTQNKTEQKK